MTKISVPDQNEYSFQHSNDTVATSPILSVAQILNSSTDWDKYPFVEISFTCAIKNSPVETN